MRFAITTLSFVFLATAVPVFAEHTLPNDPKYSVIKDVFERIGVPKAWDATFGSPSVIVAVLDAGVHIDHPDLHENIYENPDERFNGLDDDKNGFVDDMHGWNFLENNNNVSPDLLGGDDLGINHGTIVSGLIAAVGNNSIDTIGVAPHVTILPIKVMNNKGEGTVENVIEGIRYAIAQGASVINLSFSGPDSTPELNEAVATAYKKGVLVVVSAGNDNEQNEEGNLTVHKKYPVCSDFGTAEDSVIGVAALDKNNNLADFSNYGECIDIAAPGTRIASLMYFDPSRVAFQKSFSGYFQGTSLAAPFVTGAAALLKSLHPDWNAEDIRIALYASVDALSDMRAGHGKLNVGRATKVKIETVPIEISTIPQAEAQLVAPPLVSLHNEHVTETFTHQSLLVATEARGNKRETKLFNEKTDVSKNFFSKEIPLHAGDTFIVFDIVGDEKLERIVGSDGKIKVYDTDGIQIAQFQTGFKKAKLKIAVGDIDGDNTNEIVVTSEKNSRVVKIFDTDGRLLHQFFGSPERSVNGLSFTLADVTGDLVPEIITVPTNGTAKASAWIYWGDGELLRPIIIKNMKHNSATTISAGDLNADLIAELIISTPTNKGSKTVVVDSFGDILHTFTSFGMQYKGKVSTVVVPKSESSDAMIVASPEGVHNAKIRLFDARGNFISEFQAFDKKRKRGVTVTLVDIMVSNVQ